jgi:hypothetical protein
VLDKIQLENERKEFSPASLAREKMIFGAELLGESSLWKLDRERERREENWGKPRGEKRKHWSF